MTKQSARDILATASKEWPARKAGQLAGSRRFLRRTFEAVRRLGLGDPHDCAELAQIINRLKA